MLPPIHDFHMRLPCPHKGKVSATRFAPGAPLVGYESGESLARMMELGFGAIGPLRIWQASR